MINSFPYILLIGSIIIVIIIYFAIEFLLKKVNGYENDLKHIRKNNSSFNVVKNIDKSCATYIGLNKYNRKVYTRDKANHIFVCGTTGSGKTVALSNYIKSGIEKDYPMLIIDGKGDIGSDSIIDILDKLNSNRKLYVINMADAKNSHKYNPFKNTTATICKEMLVNMHEWTEEHYKVNIERYLERLSSLLIKSEIKLSFKSIVENLNSKAFLTLSKNLEEKNIINKDEHISNIELVKNSEKIIEGAVARFSLIHESDIGCIFDDEGIDIYDALKENAIILIVLNPLLYPELSPSVGKLALIDAKKAISKLYTNKKNRIFYIFDEINVYASPTLINLINKSRSANVTCIPATQSLADLEYAHGTAFKNQVIENCNNYLIMRQNSAESADEWAKISGTKLKMTLTYKMDHSTFTGQGTAKKVDEFFFHPNQIKNLLIGEALFVSKDDKVRTKLKIKKSF